MSKYKCKNTDGEIEYPTWLLVTNEYNRTNPRSKLQTAYIPVPTVCHIANTPKSISDSSRMGFSNRGFK